MNPRPSHRHGGFTLVELLVAMTIASLLIAILATALTGVSGAAQSTGARVEAEREARAVFEILGRDLATSIRKNTGWIRAIEDPDPPANGEKPSWLFFFSAPLDHDRDAPGDVCLVSYRTAHDPLPGGDEAFPSLHRAVITAPETYQNALGRPTLDNDFFADNPTADQSTRALESWLAAGVTDLQIRGYTGGTSVDLTEASTAQIDQLTAVEITVDILTKQGQRLYATLPPDQLRQRYSYRFTRRIPLPIAVP